MKERTTKMNKNKKSINNVARLPIHSLYILEMETLETSMGKMNSNEKLKV